MFISFVVFTVIFFFFFHFFVGYSQITSDGYDYYVWLPQLFIYQDFSLSFLKDVLDQCFINFTAQGYIKYGCGSAYLMCPFFLVAHFLQCFINKQLANGYTFLYQIFIWFSAIFYWVLGIVFSYKILYKNTSKKIATFACFAITFGTGLFIYTCCYFAFSHVYSFFAISLFLYLVVHFKGILQKNKKTIFQSFLIGLVLGLITAIKNFNILVFLIYILYDVKNLKSFKVRLIEFFKIKNFFPFLAGFLIPMIPLFCYWYLKTGHFIINSYHPEYYISIDVSKTEPYLNQFDFLHPNIIKAMFSLEKGLFVFYPVLLFSFIGLFYLKKYFNNFKYTIPIFLVVIIYALSSFRYWWAGSSFGLRFYLDYLSIFVIPIAAFIKGLENLQIILSCNHLNAAFDRFLYSCWIYVVFRISNNLLEGIYNEKRSKKNYRSYVRDIV